MLHRAIVLIFVLASVAGLAGCSSTTSHYVFATLPAANEVATYREDPNSGVLTEIAGSPFPAGNSATSVVIHPNGKYLYTANPGVGENDISLFSIASDGVLTEITPRTPVTPGATDPQNMVMDPGGKYLYVANATSNNISVFTIDSSTGGLSQVTGSPFPIGASPLNMTISPSGSFLYVTSGTGQNNSSFGSILGFSVNAGTLLPIDQTSSDGQDPSGIAVDPKGAFLYVTNKVSDSIAIFAIKSTGVLAEVPGSALADVNQGPVAVLVDPSGGYLYVANQGSSNIATYTIDSTTGFPTVVADSPFASEVNPSFLAIDPVGKYLFVGNQQTSPGIQAFGNSGGSLNSIFIYATGNTPSSIAVLQ
jgi:6-phosphogluconolactonase (cycloisomerase 2 family)